MDKLRVHLADPEVRAWFVDWTCVDNAWMIDRAGEQAIHLSSQRYFPVRSWETFHRIYRGLCPPPHLVVPQTDVWFGKKRASFSVDNDDGDDDIVLYFSVAQDGEGSARYLEVHLDPCSSKKHPKGLSMSAWAKLYGYDGLENEIDMHVSVQATRFVFSNLVLSEGEDDEVWPVLQEDWGLARKSRVSMDHPSAHIGARIHAEAAFRERERFFATSARAA